MTKVDAWKCDACGNIFIYDKLDPQYLNPSDIYIEIGAANQFYPGGKIIFDSVCLNCRKIIVDAINGVMDLCGSDERIFS